MIKYGLLGLILICGIITVYQLYLCNSWTSMIKNKQKEYTMSPSIQNNTKPLIHRLEACAVCLVCTFVLPTQLSMGNDFAPQEAAMNEKYVLDSDVDNMNDSLEMLEESSKVGSAPMATTSVNDSINTSNHDLIFSINRSKDDFAVSIEILNANAPTFTSEDFLNLVSSNDLKISDKTMLSAYDYLVKICSETFNEREVLVKVEVDCYIICDSVDGICYVVNK